MGYLDPGFFGLLSQIGVALLVVLVSVFTFLSKPIKKLLKIKPKKDSETESESEFEQK